MSFPKFLRHLPLGPSVKILIDANSSFKRLDGKLIGWITIQWSVVMEKDDSGTKGALKCGSGQVHSSPIPTTTDCRPRGTLWVPFWPYLHHPY